MGVCLCVGERERSHVLFAYFLVFLTEIYEESSSMLKIGAEGLEGGAATVAVAVFDLELEGFRERV